jgi:hypothetical protein
MAGRTALWCGDVRANFRRCGPSVNTTFATATVNANGALYKRQRLAVKAGRQPPRRKCSYSIFESGFLRRISVEQNFAYCCDTLRVI